MFDVIKNTLLFCAGATRSIKRYFSVLLAILALTGLTNSFDAAAFPAIQNPETISPTVAWKFGNPLSPQGSYPTQGEACNNTFITNYFIAQCFFQPWTFNGVINTQTGPKCSWTVNWACAGNPNHNLTIDLLPVNVCPSGYSLQGATQLCIRTGPEYICPAGSNATPFWHKLLMSQSSISDRECISNDVRETLYRQEQR